MTITGDIEEHVVTHDWGGAHLTLVQPAILGLKIVSLDEKNFISLKYRINWIKEILLFRKYFFWCADCYCLFKRKCEGVNFLMDLKIELKIFPDRLSKILKKYKYRTNEPKKVFFLSRIRLLLVLVQKCVGVNLLIDYKRKLQCSIFCCSSPHLRSNLYIIQKVILKFKTNYRVKTLR